MYGVTRALVGLSKPIIYDDILCFKRRIHHIVALKCSIKLKREFNLIQCRIQKSVRFPEIYKYVFILFSISFLGYVGMFYRSNNYKAGNNNHY